MCSFLLKPTCIVTLTSSLSIKHVDAPNPKSVWASIVTSLLHLTMISTKKYGVASKDRLGRFSLHDASRFSLTVLIVWLFWLGLSFWNASQRGQNLISLQMNNKLMKCLTFLFKIPKDNKDFFHGCRHDYKHHERWH